MVTSYFTSLTLYSHALLQIDRGLNEAMIMPIRYNETVSSTVRSSVGLSMAAQSPQTAISCKIKRVWASVFRLLLTDQP